MFALIQLVAFPGVMLSPIEQTHPLGRALVFCPFERTPIGLFVVVNGLGSLVFPILLSCPLDIIFNIIKVWLIEQQLFLEHTPLLLFLNRTEGVVEVGPMLNLRLALLLLRTTLPQILSDTHKLLASFAQLRQQSQ